MRIDRAMMSIAAAFVVMAGLPLMAIAGNEVTIDGVVHVQNGAVPSQGVETLELEELWRVGGEDDDTVLGVVVHALTDDEGKVYLLDMQLSQVIVISPEGEMIGTLSRQGEGPGEVNRPSDMVTMPDGSLGLLQTFPGKLIKVNRDDTPAGEIVFGGDPTAGGIAVVIDVNYVGGNLVVAGIEVKQGETQAQQHRRSYLASYGEDGVRKTVYWDKIQVLDFSNLKVREADQYNIFPRRWDISTEGDVYAAVARDEFVVNVYAPDGTLKRVIEKEFTNRKRTTEEMEFYQQLVALQTRQLPGADVQLSDTPEAIQSIDVWHDGTIWVTDSRGAFEQPEGIMATYEVFSPEGHYLKSVQVECDADGRDDGLIPVGRDRMILIRGLLPAIMGMQTGGALASDDEEAAPMEVVCYQIKS